MLKLFEIKWMLCLSPRVVCAIVLGIIERNGEEVFARRIATPDKAAWILLKESSEGDIRPLGEHRDSKGQRFLDFKGSVGMLRSSAIDDWPMVGPRAARSIYVPLEMVPRTLQPTITRRYRHQGLPFSAASHEHRVLCDMLRVEMSIDQVDVSNLLFTEIAVRRLIQIKNAVARPPSSPDYTVGPSGQAVTTSFHGCIATKLKERANVQKQARLYREEFGTSRGSGTTTTTDGERRGRGRGRGHPEAKTKPGDGDAIEVWHVPQWLGPAPSCEPGRWP